MTGGGTSSMICCRLTPVIGQISVKSSPDNSVDIRANLCINDNDWFCSKKKKGTYVNLICIKVKSISMHLWLPVVTKTGQMS